MPTFVDEQTLRTVNCLSMSYQDISQSTAYQGIHDCSHPRLERNRRFGSNGQLSISVLYQQLPGFSPFDLQ